MKLSALKTLTLASAIAAGASLTAAITHAEEYQVLAVQSLSGPVAFVGVTAMNGIKLAVEEINESGFLGDGNTIKLIAEDDSSDKNQTLTLVNRYAKADEKTIAILGPTGGGLGAPAAGIANEVGLPIMVLTSGDGVLAAGKYAFMSSQSAQGATPVLVKYALNELGHKKCATIFAEDNDAHVKTNEVFATEFKAGGGEILDSVHVKLDDADYAAAATRIAALDIDCVYVASHSAQSANIVRQLKQAGLDPSVDILGSVAMISADFISTGGGAVEGVYALGEWVPGGANQMAKDFVKTYEAKFENPLDNWAPVGYTMVYVLADALKRAGPNATRDSLRDALANTDGAEVVMGNGSYSINPETRVPSYGAVIVKLESGEFKPIN